MKAAAIAAGVLAGVFALLAVVVEHGTDFYYRVADYRARRRDNAHERTLA